MADTNGTNGNGGKLRAFADNTLALLFTRYVMPVMISVVGALMVYFLHNVDASIADAKQSTKDATTAMWAAIQKTNEGTMSTHEAVEVLISRFDGDQSARSAERADVKAQLNDHETRIRVLERPGMGLQR